MTDDWRGTPWPRLPTPACGVPLRPAIPLPVFVTLRCRRYDWPLPFLLLILTEHCSDYWLQWCYVLPAGDWCSLCVYLFWWRACWLLMTVVVILLTMHCWRYRILNGTVIELPTALTMQLCRLPVLLLLLMTWHYLPVIYSGDLLWFTVRTAVILILRHYYSVVYSLMFRHWFKLMFIPSLLLLLRIYSVNTTGDNYYNDTVAGPWWRWPTLPVMPCIHPVFCGGCCSDLILVNYQYLLIGDQWRYTFDGNLFLIEVLMTFITFCWLFIDITLLSDAIPLLFCYDVTDYLLLLFCWVFCCSVIPRHYCYLTIPDVSNSSIITFIGYCCVADTDYLMPVVLLIVVTSIDDANSFDLSYALLPNGGAVAADDPAGIRHALLITGTILIKYWRVRALLVYSDR